MESEERKSPVKIYINNIYFIGTWCLSNSVYWKTFILRIKIPVKHKLLIVHHIYFVHILMKNLNYVWFFKMCIAQSMSFPLVTKKNYFRKPRNGNKNEYRNFYLSMYYIVHKYLSVNTCNKVIWLCILKPLVHFLLHFDVSLTFPHIWRDNDVTVMSCINSCKCYISVTFI